MSQGRDLKALDVMNNSCLWITLTTLSRELRTLNVGILDLSNGNNNN